MGFYRIPKTSNSLKDIADETLLRELQKRGYKLVSLSENNDETTAEILKIG